MSIILNRLKKSWDSDCPEKICSCGCCSDDSCSCQKEEENNNNE